MAVGDEASLRPTESLLLREGRKHYRTQISPIHWQLRSLISAERDGIVYFPAGNNNTHITRLDTRARECETIKVISFHPRCLVASGGWICCGGENGEFAIIREGPGTDILAAPDSSSDSSSSSAAPAGRAASTSAVAATAALASEDALSDPTLASEPSMAELRRDVLSIVEQMSGPVKTWSASNYKFGTQRVNCITIWQPPKPPKDPPQPGRYTFPVAVLANNDKTVTVVNLHDSTAIDDIEYPDCVNRGVISPDGSLLVAICDDPFLYVHVRCTSQGKGGRCYAWSQLPRIRLKDQSVRDLSDCRGSFAVCFSSSGRYLAVGTQYGTISIFDVLAFADPERDPLITFFNSARAPGDCGAVRDMAFSPGPYDILAWTEHRGRIGVADARTNFTKRQIISIEDHDAYDHVSLSERSTAIDPRLLDPRSERGAAGSSSIPSVPGSSSRLQSGTGNSDASRLNHPSTPEETAIPEAVQDDRRRREARERGGQRDAQPAPRGGSATWRTSVFAERRDTLTRIFEREQGRENRDHQRSTTAQTPAEQERERRAPTPRRRSSIMQALAQNVDSSVGLQRFGNGEGPSTSRDYSPAWGQSARGSAGWADLEMLYNMPSVDLTLPHDTTRAETARVRRAIPIVSDVWNDDISGFRRPYSRNRDHVQRREDTAGLTWSEDGRTLYIGAEDGIYEFHLNILSRKLFPAVTFR
ncbi:putative WD domain-containing protein [Rosellinia necatrix]|uniref:Putative WD domain-containing protein n=1 Tax=Rosellinia necatrix TaxID=77044 RepID=A0A1W2TE51_ROSNE|nr:putative WD domain-containing protein [Rosellinia necatrix]